MKCHRAWLESGIRPTLKNSTSAIVSALATISHLRASETLSGTVTAFLAPLMVATLTAWFDSQYERCRKEFDHWFVDGDTVFTLGTLYGVDNEGEKFEGIRFLDVHTVRDGKIVDKVVFNDLSEAGIVDYDEL